MTIEKKSFRPRTCIAENIFDQSMLSAFLTCPRKVYWHEVLGLTTKGANIHLAFGIGIHEGRKIWLKTGNRTDAITAATESFQAYDCIPTKNKNLETLISSMEQYMLKYSGRDINPNLVEVDFSFSLPSKAGEDFTIVGRLDGVIKAEADDGSFQVLEHKTCSTVTQFYYSAFRFCIQNLTYQHALSLLMPCSGTMLDIALIPRSCKLECMRVPLQRDMASPICSEFEQMLTAYSERLRLAYTNSPDSPLGWEVDTSRCYDWSSECPFMPLCRLGVNDRTLELYDVTDEEGVQKA